ncbi:sigma 54-interacting transcriptional regulator [Tissierella sp.]|uniref:sigma-54 interaction domain-containing protein n=1 Tax=Tissierella sp. TaxID=41274 RepID=UPI0028587DF6|nr:sigma 54-interacting transcriptional regulator [Tissierella sp.]MDR7856955.1 sigma 54-interacting transcriptional regulator [Tissierella sp.]
MVDILTELRDSIDMIEDVLNYAYEGYVLVDPQGRIVKMNYEKLMGIKEEDAIGKHVEDIIENTRMHIVVNTGVKELRDVQRIQGHDMITNRIPIIKGDKIIGAVGTVLFKDISEVKELAHQLLDLQSKINKYKGEIERIEGSKYSFDRIITVNPKMNYLKKVGRMAAETNSTVLITGESGTGKELFAHAIHRASYRKGGGFIPINCAAIPRDLLESELFGYDSGAFTGAKKEGKQGKFEIASGGTIFLDEIGTMPLDMQAKLLRVLEAKEFERIGGNKKIGLDARIIAATNENIEEQIKAGKFREDLYYRLNVVSIEIPPLRDRLEDIDPLADNLLGYLVKEMNVGEKELTSSALKILKSYNWPGNARELRNVLERAINLSSSRFILPEHLPERLVKHKNYTTTAIEEIPLLKDAVRDAEIEVIRQAIILAKGNKSLAAEKLGIHRTALYKKLEKYEMKD